GLSPSRRRSAGLRLAYTLPAQGRGRSASRTPAARCSFSRTGSFRRALHWRVDPDGRRERRMLGRLVDEALRMSPVGGVQGCLALRDDGGRFAIVDGRGSQKRDAAVIVLAVVPAEERAAPPQGVV